MNDSLTPKSTISKATTPTTERDHNKTPSTGRSKRVSNEDYRADVMNTMDTQTKVMQAAVTALQGDEQKRTEDDIFGELIATNMVKLKDDDIKDELKIEIQSLILQARRKQASLSI